MSREAAVGVWLTDLADVCRSAGLSVSEVDGWRTRGHGPMSAVRGIVCHHTVGPATGEYPSLRTVRDGVPGVSGPLAQLGIGRSGTVYVVAAGVSYHAGRGSWPGLLGNDDTIGVEGESVGTRDDWTAAQRWTWPRLCGALAQHYRIPARLVIAHREWAPTRKIDPAFIDMNYLRANLIYPGGDDMPSDDVIKRLAAEAVRETVGGDIVELRRMMGVMLAWRQPAPGTPERSVPQQMAPGMDALTTAVSSGSADVRTQLGEQSATIVAAIMAAIAAAGGSIEHTVIDQAVRDAVSSLTIVLPEPDESA